MLRGLVLVAIRAYQRHVSPGRRPGSVTSVVVICRDATCQASNFPRSIWPECPAGCNEVLDTGSFYADCAGYGDCGGSGPRGGKGEDERKVYLPPRMDGCDTQENARFSQDWGGA